MLEKSWPIDDVVTLREKIDWMDGDSMDGIDYNLTGLRILPMSHQWDFEGFTTGMELKCSRGMGPWIRFNTGFGQWSAFRNFCNLHLQRGLSKQHGWPILGYLSNY